MDASSGYWFLVIWTAGGVTWWLIATLLLIRARAQTPSPEDKVALEALGPNIDKRRISIFKPLASPLGDDEFAIVRECMESFVADMDKNCELLIGGQEAERSRLDTFVAQMDGKFPGAKISLIIEAQEESGAHPKVAWNRTLSQAATGELWFWSDADILIAPGTFRQLRKDICGRSGMVTTPYTVNRTQTAADTLDALFVNLEFYPGIELLGRMDAVPGGLGAGMLFEAEQFRQKVNWDDLGSHLAEDYVLGQLLAPVSLTSARVATLPTSVKWVDGILQYLRWQKTIRWCQPTSSALQLVVLPIIGWLAWIIVHPLQHVAWLGFAAVLAIDTLAALTISRVVGCSFKISQLFVIPVWSILRGASWIACWFPWPIVWRDRLWRSPRLDSDQVLPKPEHQAALKRTS